MLKFGQIEIACKDFYSTYQVTDAIDLEKIVVSDGFTANKQDTRFTIGYEVAPGKIIPLFIKTPKNCSSNGVSRYSENSAWKMGFTVGGEEAFVEKYTSIWERVEELMFQNLTGTPLNKERYINVKLITWEDKIMTRFNGRDVPYNINCEASGVLKISSVYQQGSNHYLQVFLKECRYRDRDVEFKSQLSDDDGDSGWDTVF